MLAVVASESSAGMDFKKSVVLVMSVDVKVVDPGPCIEPRGGFLDLIFEKALHIVRSKRKISQTITKQQDVIQK